MLIDADTETLKGCLSKKRMNNVSECVKKKKARAFSMYKKGCILT
jgi:hypothetical protein